MSFNLLGTGYNLVIVTKPHCKKAKIINLVKQYIPEVEFKTAKTYKNELHFILPDRHIRNVQSLFTSIEKKKEMFGIQSYGASITTMEDVFIG